MAAPSRPRPRPVYLDLLAIRMPPPAIASILHRISGALLFFVGIPVVLWSLQSSLGSPETFASFRSAVGHPLAKLLLLALVWAYLHHLLAGLRHVLQDVHVGRSGVGRFHGSSSWSWVVTRKAFTSWPCRSVRTERSNERTRRDPVRRRSRGRCGGPGRARHPPTGRPPGPGRRRCAALG